MIDLFHSMKVHIDELMLVCVLLMMKQSLRNYQMKTICVLVHKKIRIDYYFEESLVTPIV